MPDLTADDIATAAAGPIAASVDGLSASAHPIDKQLEAMAAQGAANAATGTNVNGGPRSGWNMMRPARAITEGA